MADTYTSNESVFKSKDGNHTVTLTHDSSNGQTTTKYSGYSDGRHLENSVTLLDPDNLVIPAITQDFITNPDKLFNSISPDGNWGTGLEATLREATPVPNTLVPTAGYTQDIVTFSGADGAYVTLRHDSANGQTDALFFDNNNHVNNSATVADPGNLAIGNITRAVQENRQGFFSRVSPEGTADGKGGAGLHDVLTKAAAKPAEPPPPAPGETPVFAEKTVAGFDSGSSTLTDTQKTEWKAFADEYKNKTKNSTVAPPILLTGFADATGNRQGNLNIGMARATAVQAYLNTQGVNAEIGSGGQSSPLDPKDNAKNRRVTAVVGKDAIDKAKKANAVEKTAADAEQQKLAAAKKAPAPPSWAPNPNHAADSKRVMVELERGDHPGGYIIPTGPNQCVIASIGDQGIFTFYQSDYTHIGNSVTGISREDAERYLDRAMENPARFNGTFPTSADTRTDVRPPGPRPDSSDRGLLKVQTAGAADPATVTSIAGPGIRAGGPLSARP